MNIFTITENKAKSFAKHNSSLVNNFVRVEDIQRTSFMGMGSNWGVWTTHDIIGKNKNTTTVIHEYFHSLGLDHPSEKTNIDFSTLFKPKYINYQETSRIIVPRGSTLMVRPSVILKSITFRPLNPDERRVTNDDADEAVKNMNKQKLERKIFSSYEK